MDTILASLNKLRRAIFGAFGVKVVTVKPRAKGSILVVDDSEVDQRLACSVLNRGGYNVLKASNGKDGIALAKEYRPDLILLDYHMPGMEGPEICKILKNDEATAEIPVLFLTSDQTPAATINCFEGGGDNYLAKPIEPRFLLKQIELTIKEAPISKEN